MHERLTQLELVNKQYRRLARENRTDTASRLKQMVHEGNQRWDGLQRRVTAVLRRLRVTLSPGVPGRGTRGSRLATGLGCLASFPFVQAKPANLLSIKMILPLYF